MSLEETPPLNLRAGLWALFAFASVGLVLEGLHAFKLGLYLDVGNETRRLLWRLAHAHGALLGLLNVCFALAARQFPRLDERLVARCLLLALLLMPAGFGLGGAFARGGDPGASVGLAAAGGLALLIGLGRLAWLCSRRVARQHQP
jgi:hypothetical protein